MEFWIELVEKPNGKDDTKQSKLSYQHICTSKDSFQRQFKNNPEKISRDLLERIFDFSNKYNRSFSPSNLELKSMELFEGHFLPIGYERCPREIKSPSMLRIVVNPINGLNLRFPNQASQIWKPYADINKISEFKDLSLIIYWPGSLNIRWNKGDDPFFNKILLMKVVDSGGKMATCQREIRCDPFPISSTNF